MNKPLKISEAGTVQFPMVRHAAEIGWTTLTPDDARAKRGGDAGTFLRDVLEAKLAAFNPWLTADAVRAIAHGDARTPGGLEGLAMAIAGPGLERPLCEAVYALADAVREGGELFNE